MSSGAGAAGGVGGLDLNCEASPLLHNHGTCVEDSPINTEGGVLERERGGDGEKECERGLADREDGMVSEGVGGSFTGEAGAESHVGEILEVDLQDKGIIELDVLSTEGIQSVEASSHPIESVDESADDQERGTDVITEGVVGNDEDSVAVLSGDGGDAGECLEGSSFLRKEEIEVQAGLVDGGGQAVDGKLGIEELKAEVDSDGTVLLEAVTGESESSDLVVVSAEELEVVDAGNQPMILEDGSVDDHKQGWDDHLAYRGSEHEVKFHNSIFLEMVERSPILVTVSTEGFKPVEASSHAMEFQDGSCGDRKEGTNFDAEGMVIDDALIPTKEEDEVASLVGKVSEVNRGEKENTKLVVVSAEAFGHVESSSQPTDLACESDIVQSLGTDLDANGTVKGNDFSVSSLVALSEELVAVSDEVFEPVKVISQAIDLADGSADVPVFGTELDEKGRVGIHEESVSNCAAVGVKILELGRVDRGIVELESSTEVFDPIQASSQAIDLADESDDVQMRATDADEKDTIGISEDSVCISSVLFEHVQSSSQDIDLEDEFAHVERQGTDLEAEILELEREDKEGAETEVFELDNASTQAKDLGDGCGDDQRLGTVIEAVVGIGNNEDSVAISVDKGGPEDEMRGDLGDGRIQIVDGELGTGKRVDKVKSLGDGCMKVDMKEKGIPELGDAGGMDLGDGCAGDVEQGAHVGIKGIARTDDSLAVLASGGAVGGESSDGSLILRGWVDVQVDLLDDGSQLCRGERESEIESHGGVLSKVWSREMERSDLVAVSAEVFEDNESTDRCVNLGDGSLGDQKQEIDVDADVLVIDGQLGPGVRDTKLNYFSGHGFDGEQKGGTMVMDSELGREDEHQSQGRNFSELDCGERGSAEVMVTTTEESAVISVVNVGPEGETLEEPLVLRKEQIDVQGDFVDGSSQVGHGELGDSELIRHGEVDMGEECSMLVSSSAEWPVVVEASNQAMDVVDGFDSDKKPETDKDTDDVGYEDSVTVGVLDHLVDGCCQVIDSEEGPGGKENELESHDGKLLTVELGEKAKEMIDVSAEKYEAVEVSDQAMDLGDESNGDQTQGVDVSAKDMFGTSDDSAAVSPGGGVSENARLEESSVFRIEPPVEVLQKLVYGFGQVADGELINGERLHVVESDGEKLLKVETEEEGSAELFAISAERAVAVEACSQAIDMEDGSGGDQKPGTDVDAKFMYGNNEDSVNESLEGTLLFGDDLIKAQEDLVDGDDQVLNAVFGPGKGEGEIDRHSEMLLEIDGGEMRSSELAAVSVVASSQDMDLEDGYSSDKKHDSSIVTESMVRIDEVCVTVSVNGRGPEDELLEGSLNFVKEDVEFGDVTNGTGTAVEDLAQPMNNKDIVVDTLVHATQFRTEYGDGGPEDVKFGENQIVDEEVVAQPGLSETKLAHPDKIGSGENDAMRNAGHVNDTVNSEHAENPSSREGFNGDNMSESCVEADADHLVSHIFCQGTEAQELEGAKKSDSEQVEIIYSGDGSQMMEKFDQIQKNGDPLNVDVNEGDPHEREGELVGDDSHSQSEVISEFSGGGETMDHQPLDETVVTDSEILFEMDAGKIRSSELASISVVASSQDMDLEDGYSSDKKHDSSILAEGMVRIDEVRVTVSVNGRGPEDELEGSLHFVKDVEFSDVTNGTGTAVEDLAQLMNNKVDVKFGESQIVDEEVVTQPGLSKAKLAHPDKFANGEIDAMRNAGHVNDTVNSEHAEDPSSREGFNGDNMSESCVEADADQLVSHISCQGTEAQELEGAKKSDNEQVEIKYCSDGSQMMENFDQIQKNGNPLNVDVNERDPHEREGELVGHVGHSQCEVISEFSAGGETMDHQPLDETVVTDSLGTFRSTVLELMGGETVLPLHSTVDSNPVEVRTDASSGENDQKIYVENNTVAGESVQKLDNTVEKVEVLIDDGLVKSVMPDELQNASAQKNFDYQNQKEDSSSKMVLFREEEYAADPRLLDNFFIEKEHSIMEDSDSIFGISLPEGSTESDNPTVTMQLNESSIGYRDVRPPKAELEHGQYLQDENCEHLKELDNQIEGCCDMSIETLTSQQASYDLSFPEKEGFSTSDLVWGKVKSHPWWPGQIFDFSGASKLALKYQKKDNFLVAYFGDKTFAWCEESRLKPFQLNFSQMEKQTSSDTFSRALHDILVEISRRVELSMTCLCLPEETYADIEYQKVENAGVRGKTVNSVVNRYGVVNYFRPDKLLEYVRDLAVLPTGGADRLELTVAKAQLKAFYLSKGYTELPSFTNGSGLLENDFEIPTAMSRSMKEDDLDHSATLKDLFSTKGKSRLRDETLSMQKLIVKDGRKQKSLSELMDGEKTYAIMNGNKNASEVRDDEWQLSSGNKRKSIGLFLMDAERIKMKKTVSQVDKRTTLSSPIFNRSFKVGEFISRAASKLTCGRPLRKCHDKKADYWTNDYMDIDDFLDVPFDSPKLQIDISEDYPPASDLLSKLCLAARNPLKGYNFSSIVISFFSSFRNLQVSNFIEMSKTEKPRAKRGRKKKINPDLEFFDTSTPDHMKDSYWSDMIVPEKDAMSNPPKRRGRKKKKLIEDTSLFQVLNSPSDCESKLHIGSVCPHGKHILVAERPIITVEEKIVDERIPTAVILYFNSSDSLPSDTDLIRIFSRYGPLKEEETSVETKTNSAMVVFKKRADAEMAFSSAGKIGTFGPALLSYRLRHFQAKSAPAKTVEGEDDPPPTTDGDSRILAELETASASDGMVRENFPAVRSEAVDIESSYFNQPQMDAVNTRVETGGADEFSDPPRDAPVQTQTGIVSENLRLESVDQEFSYFDLDFAESGVVSGNMQIETVCPQNLGKNPLIFFSTRPRFYKFHMKKSRRKLQQGYRKSLPDQLERAAGISDASSVVIDVHSMDSSVTAQEEKAVESVPGEIATKGIRDSTLAAA
ncbi:hypothetical protein KSP40_PGU018602 [Platanthera guangdongensis]|uniref:PWWP domain-containing protein n=1 Tax=Platanthera guangdongensis TaxID=2320717 RepID=A0ABR2M3C7_9ASPA